MENTSMTSLAPHFESILDTLSDGVFISDAEGTTLFVNKMYETLTGLRQGEIRGKNIRTLVQQGTCDKVVNPQIVETGKPATHVQQLANGKRLVLTGYPVFDDKGQLSSSATYWKADGTQLTDTGGNIPFKNTYSVTQTTSAPVTVQKTLAGRAWEQDDKFDFTLTPADDATMKTVKNKVVTQKKAADSDETGD